VIVLSPDSIASRNVSEELSVAEERSKRIVPVLHRPARLEGAMELLLPTSSTSTSPATSTLGSAPS
jgi:hypothetical protein